jgi:hypothetical protein
MWRQRRARARRQFTVCHAFDASPVIPGYWCVKSWGEGSSGTGRSPRVPPHRLGEMPVASGDLNAFQGCGFPGAGLSLRDCAAPLATIARCSAAFGASEGDAAPHGFLSVALGDLRFTRGSTWAARWAAGTDCGGHGECGGTEGDGSVGSIEVRSGLRWHGEAVRPLRRAPVPSRGATGTGGTRPVHTGVSDWNVLRTGCPPRAASGTESCTPSGCDRVWTHSVGCGRLRRPYPRLSTFRSAAWQSEATSVEGHQFRRAARRELVAPDRCTPASRIGMFFALAAPHAQPVARRVAPLRGAIVCGRIPWVAVAFGDLTHGCPLSGLRPGRLR